MKVRYHYSTNFRHVYTIACNRTNFNNCKLQLLYLTGNVSQICLFGGFGRDEGVAQIYDANKGQWRTLMQHPSRPEPLQKVGILQAAWLQKCSTCHVC